MSKGESNVRIEDRSGNHALRNTHHALRKTPMHKKHLRYAADVGRFCTRSPLGISTNCTGNT